jgi:hypothetical protein
LIKACKEPTLLSQTHKVFWHKKFYNVKPRAEAERVLKESEALHTLNQSGLESGNAASVGAARLVSGKGASLKPQHRPLWTSSVGNLQAAAQVT